MQKLVEILADGLSCPKIKRPCQKTKKLFCLKDLETKIPYVLEIQIILYASRLPSTLPLARQGNDRKSFRKSCQFSL